MLGSSLLTLHFVDNIFGLHDLATLQGNATARCLQSYGKQLEDNQIGDNGERSEVYAAAGLEWDWVDSIISNGDNQFDWRRK